MEIKGSLKNNKIKKLGIVISKKRINQMNSLDQGKYPMLN
jgi:hypothetical protein